MTIRVGYHPMSNWLFHSILRVASIMLPQTLNSYFSITDILLNPRIIPLFSSPSLSHLFELSSMVLAPYTYQCQLLVVLMMFSILIRLRLTLKIVLIFIFLIMREKVHFSGWIMVFFFFWKCSIQVLGPFSGRIIFMFCWVFFIFFKHSGHSLFSQQHSW